MSTNNAICLVCSAPSNGFFHFGVQCCRACASFFHRSTVKERRRYVCRWNENCQINNDQRMRNSCRACRLKKCLELGMAEEKKRGRKVTEVESVSPSNQIHPQQAQNYSLLDSSFPQPLMATTSSLIIKTEQQNASSIPFTAQFAESIRQYDNGLRAFSIVEGICTEFANSREARLITHQEYLRANRAGALLVYAMIGQHLPNLRELSPDSNVKLLKTFCKQFVTFHRIHMTIQTIPEPGEPYAFIVPGGVIDKNRLDVLFEEISDVKQREKLSISIIERHFEFGKNRYSPLGISQLEFAALTGILFWDTIENCLSSTIPHDQIRSKKDAFYGELFALISDRFGSSPQQSAIRFGHLLEMLHFLTLHSLEVDEMQIMAKIFMDLPDFWDELSLTTCSSHPNI